MMSVTVATLGGLVAGGLHVLSGPDHLAALLPLATGQRTRAAAVGMRWGIGHGMGALILFALGQTLSQGFDIDRYSGYAELLVGLLLILLGALSLRRSRLLVVHSHGHHHRSRPIPRARHEHVHLHVADPTVDTERHVREGTHVGHRHSAFGFGLLHGSAGAGHLLGLLPSVALDRAAAISYLGAYIVAATATMSLFALGVGLLTENPRRLPLFLKLAASASIAVGSFWTYSSASGLI